MTKLVELHKALTQSECRTCGTRITPQQVHTQSHLGKSTHSFCYNALNRNHCIVHWPHTALAAHCSLDLKRFMMAIPFACLVIRERLWSALWYSYEDEYGCLHSSAIGTSPKASFDSSRLTLSPLNTHSRSQTGNSRFFSRTAQNHKSRMSAAAIVIGYTNARSIPLLCIMLLLH